MNTNIINKYAAEATVLDTAAKNIRHSARCGFLLTIGGRFEGTSHPSTGEIRMLNHAHMPQAVRDQLANAIESMSQVLKGLIKAEADAPLEEDHHDLYHKAMDGIKDRAAERTVLGMEKTKTEGMVVVDTSGTMDVHDFKTSDEEPEVEAFNKLQGIPTP
jgi:hypothetical protein